MANKPPYDADTYRRFAENSRGSPGPKHPTPLHGGLRRKSLASARRTANGSVLWASAISSRQAPRPSHLGDDAVQLPRPTAGSSPSWRRLRISSTRSSSSLKTQPFVHIRRQMGDNREFNPVCNLYVSVSDPKNYRLAYEWP